MKRKILILASILCFGFMSAKTEPVKITPSSTYESVAEWYSNKYDVDFSDATEVILNYMGSDAYVYVSAANDKVNWVQDLFTDFPELKNNLLIVGN